MVCVVVLGQTLSSTTQVIPASHLVKLNVIVTDESNHAVNDLQREDFLLTEDGVTQTILFFSKDVMPVSCGLLIDSSGSLKKQFDMVIKAGGSIISKKMPDDESFIISFVSSDNITTQQDFTSDREALLNGLHNIDVQGGQTAIVDAVYLSAKHLAERKEGDEHLRRALIVITDGEDRASYYKLDELLKYLRQQNLQIFIVGLVQDLDKTQGLLRPSSSDRASKLIKTLTEETGGRAFFPKNANNLQNAVDEIVHDLHTQYVLGYNPTNEKNDGKFRKIQVKLADISSYPKRIVVARKGYIALSNPPQSSPSSKN